MGNQARATPEWLEQYKLKRARAELRDSRANESAAKEPAKTPDKAKKTKKTPKKGPNDTERRYRRIYLEHLADEGAFIMFQPMRLYLSNGHSYRPDFGVFWTDGRAELHEVKGGYIYSRDSKILFDTARVDYPWWDFVWAQEKKDGWKVVRG
jgi:hypothetical protein